MTIHSPTPGQRGAVAAAIAFMLCVGVGGGAVAAGVGVTVGVRAAAHDCGPAIAPYVPLIQGWTALGTGVVIGVLLGVGGR